MRDRGISGSLRLERARRVMPAREPLHITNSGQHQPLDRYTSSAQGLVLIAESFLDRRAFVGS